MSGQARNIPHGFSDALQTTRQILSLNHELVRKGVIDTEAELIVMGAYRLVTGKSLNRIELFSRAEDRLPEEVGQKILVMALARADGRILQHLTGTQVFLDHEYEVGPDVLVPRPETEILAFHAIEKLKLENEPPRLGIEIGIGSGILSISLLAEFPALRIIASDLTSEAITRAQANAEKILGAGSQGSSRLRIIQAAHSTEILEAFIGPLNGQRADFIICNPPYLLQNSSEVEEEVRQHEPAAALFAPTQDALFFYRAIASRGREFLIPGGFAFLEMSDVRAVAIATLFRENGWQTQTVPDLTEKERVLIAASP